MSVLLVPLFLIALVLYVSLPMLSEKSTQYLQKKRAPAENGEDRKQSLLRELHDIEMDYLTNKLSEEDFRELKHLYEGELIAVLKKADRKK